MSSLTSPAVLIAAYMRVWKSKRDLHIPIMHLFELREQGGETQGGKEVVKWTQGEWWFFLTVVYNSDLIKRLQLLLENTFFFFFYCVVSFTWSICWMAEVVEKEGC